MDLTCDDARLTIDPASGVLREIMLRHVSNPLLDGASGFFDIALPLPDDLPHRLRIDESQRTSHAAGTGDECQLRFDTLRSTRGAFEVSASLTLRSISGEGLAMRLQVINHTPYVIPQVLFPKLVGFNPTGEAKHEALHLGRSIKHPHQWMTTPHGAAAFFDLYRRWYFTYGMGEWNLKWLRLGNARHGVSIFSKDLGAAVQGLYVEREKDYPRLTIAWAHYPHIAPGETWLSPEIVVQPHHGDWRIGVEAYKAYAAQHLPTARLPKSLHGSLGARSVYFSTYLYDREPNFTYRDLPKLARDGLIHGLRELICWFIFDAYFELPMKLNPKLGTERELIDAVAECRAMGVNVVAFVSCRSLKSRKAPAEWFETDEHGNRRTQSWSYSLDFVPPFNPLYCNRDESAFACPAAAGYQEAFIAACRELQRLGFSSICYDQLFADRLCYAEGHRHKPQALLEPLYATMKRVLAEGRAIDPEATFSGEFFNDISQTFQHYNWDWLSGANSLADLEPFRRVFPRYRLGLLVDRSKRWLLEGFVRGLFIHFLPDGGEGLIATDANFAALAQRLADARQRFASFFEQGEYFGTQNVGDSGSELASLYRDGQDWMLIVANIAEQKAHIESHKLIPVAAASPPALLAPYDFRIYLWRQGQEQWTTI
jgi:hypothetical protein